MGRGSRDPRPPIEVWGGEPTTTDHRQIVTTGPRRPRRSRTRALAVGAGVLVLLVGGGLVLADDDGPAATDRAATPVGPVFGEAVGAGLLTFGGEGTGWELVDLDTGRRTASRTSRPAASGRSSADRTSTPS